MRGALLGLLVLADHVLTNCLHVLDISLPSAMCAQLRAPSKDGCETRRRPIGDRRRNKCSPPTPYFNVEACGGSFHGSAQILSNPLGGRGMRPSPTLKCGVGGGTLIPPTVRYCGLHDKKCFVWAGRRSAAPLFFFHNCESL